MNVDNILNRLDKVKKKSANSWVACCPVHGEKTPSFCITIKNDKVLVKCFGCGAGAVQVMEALPGLTWDDFLPERLEQAKRDYDYIRFPASDILSALAYEATILSLAALSIKEGDSAYILNPANYERVQLACERITKAADYAR